MKSRLGITQSRKLMIIGIILSILVSATIALIYHIKGQSQQALTKAQQQLSQADSIKYRYTEDSPITSPVILRQDTRQSNALVEYQGSYFVATSGGLLQYDDKGQLIKHYTNLAGLPENELTALATFGQQLFIGTRSQGLVTFDGQKFGHYQWPGHETQAITALLNDAGRLLIGTFSGGLLEFDGHQFQEIRVPESRTTETKATRLKGINFVLSAKSVSGQADRRLYIGTFNEGLWIIDPTTQYHFTTAQGLLSNRVVGLVQIGNNLVVASDFGVATIELDQLTTTANPQAHSVLQLPMLSSISKIGSKILLATENGLIQRLNISNGHLDTKSLEVVSRLSTNNLQMLTLADHSWLLSSQGVWQLSNERQPLVAFGQITDKANTLSKLPPLASNLVSALAIDNLGRLWIGYFRKGLDIYEAQGRLVAHLEDDYLREINSIQIVPEGVIVASGQGLFQFNPQLQSQRISRTEGLLSNSINNVQRLADNQTLLLATAKGLATLTKADKSHTAKLSVMTTVQGLPSNSVYTVLPLQKSLYVGTLSGLAEIANGQVVRTYKDANSTLSSNWISALSVAQGALFIGTYGGGVYQLMPSGQLQSFAAQTGRLTVNTNALFSDSDYLYVGTLNGLWVYSLAKQQWSQITRELPSQNVLSITADAHTIYIGTMGGIAQIDKNFLTHPEQKLAQKLAAR